MDDKTKSERSAIVKERFRRAARKVKNYWIFTRRSSFEGFFASKGSAFALPDGDFARKASKNGGEMQMHLQSMVNLLRDDDILRLVVKLEGASKDRVRYLTVVSAFNDDDIEESIAVGVDWINQRATCSIGLILPLWRDTKIELDGDGGFIISANYRRHILKPVSVQTMWTAVQWIHRCSENARKNNHFPNGLSHQWANFYSSHISSDQSCIHEWYEMEDVSSKLIQLPTGITVEEELMMKLIRHKLKEVMLKVDLEEVTSRQIRVSLEDEMKMDLKKYKQYIDEEMLTILGQMDSASQIYEHVYLGSEWNASNLEELRENGVGYILNISREIDNFFSGTFKYLNIRLYDEDESDLLPYWENTYKFINTARENGMKVLVHCKMGMSRSASTVIAYGMKEYGLSLHDTMKHVKSKRAVINPNPGFWKQLITYEGILISSKQRFNPVFSSPGRRRTNSDDLEVIKGAKRRRSRRGHKSKTITIGEKMYPEPIVEAHASTLERSMFVVGEDADVESLDEDSDDDQPCFKTKTSSSDNVLRTWERSLSENIEGSSLSSSVDYDMNEDHDTVGVLEKPRRKPKTNRAPELHRAKSVPALHVKNNQLPKEIVEPEVDELHRCASLHEFLSGKVRKLKEDFKVHSLERQTGSHGSIERRSASHPTSPVGEEDKENTNEANIKRKLKSTLSDPSYLVTTSTMPDEVEKEDKGSVPDQGHTVVVHRDAQGIVKSGTVKRQSRNFEEGRVNLPWEWEEALNVLKNSEQETNIEDTPDSPSTTSEMHPSAEDGPPIGVVKMHAQKFQGSLEIEEDSIELEQVEGIDQTEKDASPKLEESSNAEDSPAIISEMHPSAVDEPPIGVVKMHAQKFQGSLEIEGDNIELEQDKGSDEASLKREESLNADDNCLQERTSMQRSSELFQKDVDKVNEEMMKERSRRRLGSNSRSTENTKTEETIESSSAEVQESDIFGNGNLESELSPCEDPLPGTVRKHTQAIEDKYQQVLKTSSVESFEDLSGKQTETELTAEASTTTGLRSEANVNERKNESDNPEDIEVFDVDVLLRRVNEDMQREREEQQVTEGFRNYGVFSLEESLFEDIKPESENADVYQEEDDESEAPRPGTVKRNTELFLGKGNISPKNTEKNSTDDTVADVVNEPTFPVASRASSSPEKTKIPEDTVKSNSESDAAKGLVKRHTLVYEGVIPFVDDDDTLKDAVEQPETKGAVEHAKKDSDTDEDSCAGAVKRNTLMFERKLPNDEVETLSKPSDTPSTSDSVTDTSMAVIAISADQSEDSSKPAGTLQESVDTSSVVNVKLHLKLLEEVIGEANKRENHKQRTTKALADLEYKRKQIEMEQTKLDVENTKELVIVSSSVKDNGDSNMTDEISLQDTKDLQTPQEELVNTNQDDSNNEMPPSVGTVRLRTQQLEERIQGSSGDDVAKSVQPLRRTGSMPRTTRPIDRPIVRQRSMSDLQGRPSTSQAPVESSSPLVLDGQTDKNKLPKVEGQEPDNDRDSEKISDDLSDKIDDDLSSKSVEIFELQGRDIKLNEMESQIPNRDNKDLQYELK